MTGPQLVIVNVVLLSLLGRTSVAETLPSEPVEIGTTPQFPFDRYIIDNHWRVKYKKETVRRVFHTPAKHEENPLMAGQGGYSCVLKDEDGDLFRMWYQTWIPSPIEGQSGRYAIAKHSQACLARRQARGQRRRPRGRIASSSFR